MRRNIRSCFFNLFYRFSVLITIIAEDLEKSAGVAGPGAFTANTNRFDQLVVAGMAGNIV